MYTWTTYVVIVVHACILFHNVGRVGHSQVVTWDNVAYVGGWNYTGLYDDCVVFVLSNSITDLVG